MITACADGNIQNFHFCICIRENKLAIGHCQVEIVEIVILNKKKNALNIMENGDSETYVFWNLRHNQSDNGITDILRNVI